MAAPAFSRKEWDKNRRAIESALRKGHVPLGRPSRRGESAALVVASHALHISCSTLFSRCRIAKSRGWPAPDWKIFKAVEQKTGAIPQAESDTARSRAQMSDLRKRLDAANKHIADLEDVRKGVFALDPQKVSVPQWQLQKHTAQHHPEIPVLLTSDFQCGEVIRSRELDYPNDYSPEIFSQRYRALVDTTIKLSELHDPKLRYPGFIYCRGGDAISGNIHADLAETQSLVCTEQVKLVAQEEIRGLELLLKVFPKISVYSVPGNHDRTTIKPRAKRYVELSYDDLCIWFIEGYFQAKGETRITFSAPRSGDAYFQVYKLWLLLTHGDRMGSRGGQGFIGPAATIMRGIQKIRMQYARVSKPVDYVMHGHYHTEMDLPHGISNGSLAGFNEYAKNELRAEPEPPSQTMFFVHPHWGITSRRRIQVAR